MFLLALKIMWFRVTQELLVCKEFLIKPASKIGRAGVEFLYDTL